jgi:hypothetical protein
MPGIFIKKVNHDLSHCIFETKSTVEIVYDDPNDQDYRERGINKLRYQYDITKKLHPTLSRRRSDRSSMDVRSHNK